MKTLAISMGKFYKDFMLNNGNTTYQDISFYQIQNSHYLKIRNDSAYPICFCLPSKANEKGIILEMGSQSENTLSKDIFRILSKDHIRICYFIDEKRTIANKIVLEAQDINLKKNIIQFNVYQMELRLNGIYVWPNELGIHQLIYIRIISETGKEVISENSIEPSRESKLFYSFNLEDYGFKANDKIKEMYCVFNLEYTLRRK